MRSAYVAMPVPAGLSSLPWAVPNAGLRALGVCIGGDLGMNAHGPGAHTSLGLCGGPGGNLGVNGSHSNPGLASRGGGPGLAGGALEGPTRLWGLGTRSARASPRKPSALFRQWRWLGRRHTRWDARFRATALRTPQAQTWPPHHHRPAYFEAHQDFAVTKGTYQEAPATLAPGRVGSGLWRDSTVAAACKELALAPRRDVRRTLPRPCPPAASPS